MKRILHGLSAPLLLAVFLFVLPSAKVNAQVGCMTVGSFDLSGGGTLSIQVINTTPCTGHDQLQLTGTAILGGTLEILDLPGFVKPNTAAGNDYVVLTSTGLSGNFTSTNFPTIAGMNPMVNLVWSWSKVGNNVVVNVKDPCNPDITPPTIACPANTTIFTNPANQCTSPFNIQALASSSDNCGTPTITTISVNALPGYTVGSPVVLPAGVNAVEYTVSDGAGNTTTCSYNVTVSDNDPPILNCPPNITVQSSGGDDNIAGDCGATVQWSAFTVSDNCPGVNVVQIAGPAIGTFVNVGVSTVTYRATDLASNTSTCSFTVTVVDNEPPVMVANMYPTSSTVACPADALVAPSQVPTVNDNCTSPIVPTIMISAAPACEGTVTHTYSWSDGFNPPVTWVYTYTVEYQDFTMPANAGSTVACPAATNVAPTLPTVMDNCGNILTPGAPVVSVIPTCEGDRTYTYTYTDCEGNTHDWVYTYTVEYNDFSVPANGSSTVACPNDTDVAPVPPTVMDNCGVTLTPTGPVVSAKPSCEGTRTYTWTYTDCEGNTHDWVYTYTIEYNDFMLPADGSSTVACPNNTDVVPVPPTVMDNCGVTLTPTGPVVSPKPSCEGTRTYTWTYTDCEGNTHNWVYTYTIEYLDFSVPAGGSSTVACPNDTDVVPVPPTVMDNCGVTLTPTGPVVSPKPTCEGTRTYTWTYTDCEGNSHPWVYTYTIEYLDFTVPSNGSLTVDCPNDTDVVPVPPTVMDNCGVTLTPTGPVVSPKPACEGTRTYTWTYTDCEGNTHPWVYTYTIEYEDFIMPANTGSTVACHDDSDVIPTPPTVMDNCGVTLTPTGPVDSGEPACEGTRTYTWTYTDCEGNSHQWVYTYTVDDNIAPTAVCPMGNVTVTLNAMGQYTLSPAEVNALGAGSSDNCGVAVTFSLDDTFFNCDDSGDTDGVNNLSTRTLTVTDCALNTSTCSVTFRIMPLDPLADNVTETAVCSDVNFSFNLQSYIDNMVPSNFSYTANYGAATGGAYNPGPGTSATLSETLTNITNAVVNVVYTISTFNAASGCQGSTFTLTVPINPEPVVGPQSTTVCSDVANGLILADDVDGPSAVTYNITNITTNGLTASAGMPATGTGFANNVIADDAWTNTTDAPVNVIYTVVPVSGAGCLGNPFTVTITVNPEPVVANQTVGPICSDVAFGVNYNGDPGLGVLTYNLISIANPGSLTPRATVETAGTMGMAANALANDVWENKTNATQTVTYTVEPVSADGCVGATFTVTATIRPEPVVNSFASAAACSDVNVGASSTLPTSPVNTPVAVATYRWTSLTVPGTITVNGAADPLALPLGTINSSTAGNYPFNLTNTGGFAGIHRAIINNDNFNNVTSLHDTVRYRIIPITSVATGSCAGDTFQVKVPVYPEPVGAGSTETACSGVTFNFDLNENLTNLGAYPNPADDDLEPVTFNWQITSMTPAPFAVGAAVGDTGSGATLTDNVTNIFNFPLTVNYTVTPTSTFGCAGTPFVVSVVVNNKPLVTLNPNGDNTLCQGEQRTLLGNATNLPPSTFTYEWSIVSASPGNASLANANTQNAVLTAQTDNTNALTVKLKVINAEGCADSTSFTFTVNPVPTFAGSEPLDLAACATVANGQQGIFNLSNSVPTTTGSITYHVSASDANAGIGAIPNPTTYTGNNGQEIWVRLTGVNGCYAVQSIILTVNPLPVASISGDLVLCAGESTTLTASGGGTYSWSNMAITQAITVSPAANTTYTVVVTDGNGCTDSESVTVIVNPLPVAVITPSSATICNGASATLTATGGSSYAWSNMAVTPSITVSPASTTSYTVTVTDANGCTDSESATINVNPNPTFAVGEPLALNACESVQGGGVGTFNLNNAVPTTSGTITFHVSQSDAAAGTGDIANAATYTGVDNQVVWVRVEDVNGCYAVASFALNTWTLPTAGISGDLEICAGESTTLTASGGTSYLWSTMANTSSITVSPAVNTNYSVVVTDANGCSNSTSATVIVNPLPIATISASDELVCAGDAVTLIASGGGTYSWSTMANTAAITVNVNATTTYTVTVTDVEGCSNTASKTITVSPAMAWSSATATDASCNGGNDGSVSATVSGGTPMVTLSWEDGDGNPSATSGLTAGTYHVTATDAAGCTIDTLLVVGEPSAIQIQGLIVTNVLCNGDSTGTAFATITGGTPLVGGYNVTLTGSALTLTQTDFGFYFDQLPADTYTVDVEDDNGCVASTQFTITEPTALQVSATAVNAACFGGNGTINGFASGGTSGYTFFIDFPNGGQASPVFSAPAGTYMFVVEDSHSCRDSVAVVVGQPTALAATTSSTNESCTTAEDGTATVNATGGTPQYTYAWSNGQTSAIATGLAAGTYTVTVTDNNGCTTTASATVGVTGPGAPQVVNCPSDTTLYVLECDISFAWVAPTITDNCNVIELDVDLGGAVNEGYAAGVQQANFAIGTYTVTYTNPGPDTVACTFDVTVIDTIAPVILCPPTERIACIEDISAPLVGFVAFINAGGVLNDNCTVDLSSVVHVSTLSTGTPECVNKDTLIRTYSVVDIYNNSNTCEQLIIVKDSIAPTFVTYALDTLINCDADSTALALGAPTGDDNCNAPVTYSHSNSSTQGSDPADCTYYNYVVTRTWVVTDACGNTATDNQIITVQDTTAPTPVCVNTSVNLLPSGMVSIVPADVNGTSSDNCMPSGLLNLTATPTTFTCGEVGPNNVVLTVTDACGNSATCVAVVTVVDTEPPVAICNAAIDVYLDAAGMATIDTTDTNNGSWDNCAIDTMTLSVYNFNCSNVAVPVTVQMVVFDVYGNSDTCYTVVTVIDTIAPIAVCTTTTLYLDAMGVATLDAQDLDGGSSDACGGLTFSANPSNFTCANVGSNSSVLTVTDINGNSSTCVGTVMVFDTIDPVAICQNITIQLNSGGTASIVGSQLNNGSSDACGIASYSANPNTFTCANVGPNTVVMTVTDVNGNTATCTSIVTVQDLVPPVALCQNITIQLDVTGNASIVGSQLNNGSSDACGIASYSANPNTFTCANVGPNTVVMTVTDVNGNTATCTSIVTVQDLVPPVALCKDITIQLNAGGTASITGSQLNNGSSDACGIASYSANPNTFNCSNVGPNTVVMTVTDVNGNTSTCTSIVTVQDLVPPVAICQNVTVNLDVNGNGSTTAAAVNNGSNDACGIDTMYLNIYDFDCSDVGSNTVVLTVVDVNGNSATCSATVTVIDAIAPNVICSDTTIYLNANGLASVTAVQLDGGSTDACGGLTYAASQTSFDCGDIGANNVILTVTDVNGNSATCIAIVTVEDTLAPVFSQCPGNSTLNSDPNGCYQNYQIVLDTIFDNCTAPGAIAVQVKGRVVANNGVIPMTISPLGVGGYTITATFGLPVGNNRITVIATDAEGNVDSCQYFVQVNDIWAPIISNCPADVTVNVNPTLCTAQAFWPVPIPSDNCSGVMMTTQNNNQYFPGYAFPLGTTNVVYTATDASGNTTTCSFNVNVVGTCTPPAPDLSPEHTTGSTSYAPGQTKNVVVRIRNLSANPTTAPITFYVQKMLPNFTIFVDPNATTATVGVNNFSVMNSDWVITEQATRWRFVSKPGVVINGNTTNFVAVQLTAAGNQGSTANMTTTVVSGTGGGETPTNNNIKVSSLSIN
ncbi:MAG: PKD-like domain-containing protein [Saprospiraceae bacterium]